MLDIGLPETRGRLEGEPGLIALMARRVRAWLKRDA
jgi:hypothetical protein